MELEPSAAIGYQEILRHWFLQSIAMALTALILPNLVVTSIFGAAFMVAALALVNATLWDTTLFYFIPDSFTLHAIAVFVANGAIFWVLVKILPGIEVRGVLAAFAAPVIFTVFSVLISIHGRNIELLELGKRAASRVISVKDALISSGEKPDQTNRPNSEAVENSNSLALPD